MMNIRTVTVLGANGNMGSQCAGLIAAFGNAKIFMVTQSIEKSNEGIAKAINSVRSDTIKKNLVPKTYSDLETCIPQSDWVLEAVSENIKTKQLLNVTISKFIKPGIIISTTSSSLSVNNLAQDFDKVTQKFYFGTHFFNPPYKLTLCEIIPNQNSNKKVLNELVTYLKNVLLRQVVVSQDGPAFIANRIAFEVLNKAVFFAEKHNHLYIDSLLGGISGRVLPPLATIDLIGLDVYKSVIENIGLPVPDTINNHLSQGNLGRKSGKGYYEKGSPKTIVIPFVESIKEKIQEGRYIDAYATIMQSRSKEAKIIQYFTALYIHTSLSLIGTVAESLGDIDKAMAYGYNWLPPGALIDVIGGKSFTISLLKKCEFTIPTVLAEYQNTDTFYTQRSELDYRSFLRAI